MTLTVPPTVSTKTKPHGERSKKIAFFSPTIAKRSKKGLTNTPFALYNSLPLEKGFFKCAVLHLASVTAIVSESYMKERCFSCLQ